MFAIFLSFFIPILILEIVFFFFLYGSAFVPPWHATPDQLQAFAQHQREMSRQAMLTMQKLWYITYPVGLLFGLIFYGLISGAGTFAYRALVPEGPPAEAKT